MSKLESIPKSLTRQKKGVFHVFFELILAYFAFKDFTFD
jgi:hypothetical protein